MYRWVPTYSGDPPKHWGCSGKIPSCDHHLLKPIQCEMLLFSYHHCIASLSCDNENAAIFNPHFTHPLHAHRFSSPPPVMDHGFITFGVVNLLFSYCRIGPFLYTPFEHILFLYIHFLLWVKETISNRGSHPSGPSLFSILLSHFRKKNLS